MVKDTQVSNLSSMATPASSSTSPQPAFVYSRLKDSLRKYGRTGVGVYLGISFCVTTGFYIAIEHHFDVKKFLGIEDKPDREPSLIERVLTGKGSSVALAILCSKAMVPIKLPVAVAVTPYVHRTLQGFFKGAASKGI